MVSRQVELIRAQKAQRRVQSEVLPVRDVDIAFAEYLRGKRVVLVFPAGYTHGMGLGEEIDAYDVIVRVNLDCPVRTDIFQRLYPDKYEPHTEDIGTRTDVLYHTLFNDDLARSSGQDHSADQARAWLEDGVQWVVTRGATGSRSERFRRRVSGVPVPLLEPPRGWYSMLKRRIGGTPNMGVVAMAHLLEQPLRSLHVIGAKWTEPWEGYRPGYGGFTPERARIGDGRGHWGKSSNSRPHPQEPQIRYVRTLYRTDYRLTFDDIGTSSLGVQRDPSVTALVLIKGQSERVPGKNTRPLAGRPLLRWMLDTLIDAERVSRIVVDTDSEAVVDLVRAEHPRVEFVMNTPRANANEVIEYDLTQIEGEHFLQTHVTNPLLSPETIDRAVDRYFAGEGDSLFGVTERHMRLYRSDGTPLMHDPMRLERSQDVEPLYEDNSTLYLFSRSSFEATGTRIGRNPQMFPVSKVEATDIDYEEDFELAEALMARRLGKVRRAA